MSTMYSPVAVSSLDNLGALGKTVEDLGRRHAGYGVKDAHYDSVGVALLWTLEQGLGAAWTPEAAGAWNTILARGYQGGTDLSGGQWQRVALARALCAVSMGAGVVLLDEPTAQLDVRAEAEIFDRILAATRMCTTILISHRFSTVRHADRICVLEHGKVVELGSHEELMAAGGRYRTMFDLQAARFAEGDFGDIPEEQLDDVVG